jgi:mevalonate kinase
VNPWKAYSTSVPGKWVLAGEHTVLRGGRAIALPHPDFSLKLDYRPAEGNLEIEPDLGSPVMHELLRIAREWLAKRGVRMDLPQGSVRIRSTIPFGAGLGSSAALSVATARWVLAAHSLDRSLERELAREMENHFHGKSSGMDVATVSIAQPILFSMRNGAVELGLQHLPRFEFFDTGLRASTKDCIAKVDALRTDDPKRGEVLDREMGEATAEILEGLRAYDEAVDRKARAAEKLALGCIERGMERAASAFDSWGLVPEEVGEKIRAIRARGFRAPRITGAGGGGFIVAMGIDDASQ